MSSTTPILPNGRYQIVLAASNFVLDANGKNIQTNGCNVQLWQNLNGENQWWNVTFNPADGTYRIDSVAGKRALDAVLAQTNTNGCNIQIVDWNGGNNQKWVIESLGNNRFVILSKQVNKALDADFASKDKNGCKVQLWDVNKGPAQAWLFNPVIALNPKWFGTYKTATKWGGATGEWKDFATLVVLSNGKVTLGSAIGFTVMSNVVFKENGFTFSNADGSKGEINFVEGCADPYYFSPATKQKSFVGTYQPPTSSGSGGLDFRGEFLMRLDAYWVAKYKTFTKWGGATGQWQQQSELVITLQGQVSLGGVALSNVVFKENGLTFSNADGSRGEANFGIGNADPYYFSPAVNGKTFVGVYQPPAATGSGGLDFKGQVN